MNSHNKIVKRSVWVFPLLFWWGFSTGLVSCQKWTDKPGPTTDSLKRPYCNNPEAVNYNWDFPGTPDSSVCYFPSDIFAGTYILKDSIYDNNFNLLDTVSFPVTFTALSHVKLNLENFCNQPLTLTADRNFTAKIDTVVYRGQILCRATDTANGIFYGRIADTLKFSINVWSDTAYNIHKGTAIKR